MFRQAHGGRCTPPQPLYLFTTIHLQSCPCSGHPIHTKPTHPYQHTNSSIYILLTLNPHLHLPPFPLFQHHSPPKNLTLTHRRIPLASSHPHLLLTPPPTLIRPLPHSHTPTAIHFHTQNQQLLPTQQGPPNLHKSPTLALIAGQVPCGS